MSMVQHLFNCLKDQMSKIHQQFDFDVSFEALTTYCDVAKEELC